MTFYGQDLAYIQEAGFGGPARGAAPEIVRLLKSAGIPIRSVVDAGCGAGVLAAALVEAGFSVTGIDHSADLLTIPRDGVPQARFVNASIYEAEIPCSSHCGRVSHLPREDADADRSAQSFFERASAILPSGGVLLFDVIETGEPHYPEDFGVPVRIGQCCPKPGRTKPRGRSSARSKHSGGRATSIGGGAKSIIFACSKPGNSAGNFPNSVLRFERHKTNGATIQPNLAG